MDTKYIIGLSFLGFTIISLCIYAAWNMYKRGIPIRRAADDDAKLVEDGQMPKKEFIIQIQSMVPSLISATAVLAGITIAAVFIVTVQFLFGEIKFHGIELGILLTVLCLASISAICWILVLEQLTQMRAASIDYDRLKKYQHYTYDLWFVELVLILISIYFILLLANEYIAMVAGFVTLWIMVGYWNIHCGWYLINSKKRRDEES